MEYAVALGHLSQAASMIYDAGKNVKIYQEQCDQLCAQCTVLVNTLRENSGKLVGTDFMRAIDEAEFALMDILKQVQMWSSWNQLMSLLRQSQIKQGIDDMRKRLDHCATRFNMMSQMDILANQEDARLAVERKHAETQEKLHLLLDSIRNVHAILEQPVTKIEGHMLDIQEVIHAEVAEPEQQHRLQQHLLDIHRQKTELLPPMIDLTGEVRRIRDDPINISGGYCDVYLGEWLGEEKVALKLTRGINQTSKAQKRFKKEVAIWRELQHKNVTRLYGVATLGGYIYAVSPWMEHGDAIRYIENNPDADRLKILREAATGLEFLHNRRFVHGDLRGANILISDAGVACITDFGLSIVLEEEADPQSSTVDYPGNCRWTAPELIKPDLVGLHSLKPNKATDVWSFGMLCLEILTGRQPFHNRPRSATVITDLICGVLPPRPPGDVTDRGLSDGLWLLMQQCWARKPEDRPAMNIVIQKMKTLQLKQPSSLSSQPGDIPTPIERVFDQEYRFRHQPSSVSSPGSLSFASPSRRSYEPPSPHSGLGSFRDTIKPSPLPLNNTRRMPPNIVVSVPETHFNTTLSSPMGAEDSHRLSLTIDENHTKLFDDVKAVTPTGLNGQKRVSIPKDEESSSSGPSKLDIALLEHSGERSTTSRPRGDISDSTLSCIKYRKDGVIAAASLPALVERLIHSSSDHRQDVEFMETFLMTYKAFTNAEEVFSLLIERFNTASSPHHTPEQRASVRYSVLKVLITWLEGHHSQAKDLPLLERMQAFTELIQHSAPAPTIVASAGRVRTLIETQMSILSVSPVFPLSPISLPPSPRTPAHSFEDTPQAFARALTRLESDRYAKIMPSDCIGWLVDVQDNNEVSCFITENDRLSYWVRVSILKPNHHLQRSERRRYFLSVAEECRKLRNYSSSSAIFAGLASPSIAGLKRTAILGKPETKVYAQIEKLLSPHKNYQAYRKALKASAEPCLPMFYVHLGDTKKTHSSCDTIIKTDGQHDMVNFGLYHDLQDQIRQMLSFQHPPLKPSDGPSSQDTRVFIDNLIRSVVVDDALCQRLEKRAAILDREEHADFVSRTDELRIAGFVRPT